MFECLNCDYEVSESTNVEKYFCVSLALSECSSSCV